MISVSSVVTYHKHVKNVRKITIHIKNAAFKSILQRTSSTFNVTLGIWELEWSDWIWAVCRLHKDTATLLEHLQSSTAWGPVGPPWDLEKATDIWLLQMMKNWREMMMMKRRRRLLRRGGIPGWGGVDRDWKWGATLLQAAAGGLVLWSPPFLHLPPPATAASPAKMNPAGGYSSWLEPG